MTDDKKLYTALSEITQKDNFCGAGPFETGANDPMLDACNWHDNAYMRDKLHGGEELRAKDDAIFLKEELTLNKLYNLPPVATVKSYVYYGLVRAFGWIPWWFNRSNGT